MSDTFKMADIKDALITAYSNKQGLYGFLLNALGERLSDIVFVERAATNVIEYLVEGTRAQGRSRDLVTLTWAQTQAEIARLWPLLGASVQYVADTGPGIGGSPVLTANGGLIAPHHAARLLGLSPNLLADGKVGQGGPIWPIRAALVDSGIDIGAL